MQVKLQKNTVYKEEIQQRLAFSQNKTYYN